MTERYWTRLLVVAALALATVLVLIGLWSLLYTAVIQAPPASPASSLVGWA